MTAPRGRPLPDRVHRWVQRELGGELGGGVTATDVGGTRANSQVWRVTGGDAGQAVFLKISPNRPDFDRELHAYRHITQRLLGAGTIATLLGHDPKLRVLLLSEVPGVTVSSITAPAALARIHQLAGSLLARWHTHRLPGDRLADRARILVDATARAQRAGRQLDELDAAGHSLSLVGRTLLDHARRELPRATERVPVVFRHGDYGPRNWHFDPTTGVLAVLDHEKAEPGPAAEDLVWLAATTWPVRPALKTAFLRGLGRCLDPREERLLRASAALSALSYLHTGVTRGEPELVRKGSAALQGLTTPPAVPVDTRRPRQTAAAPSAGAARSTYRRAPGAPCG